MLADFTKVTQYTERRLVEGRGSLRRSDQLE